MQSSRKGKGRLFLLGVFSAMIVVLLLLGGCGGGGSNDNSDVPSPSPSPSPSPTPSPSPNPGTKWVFEDLKGHWQAEDGAGMVFETGVGHPVDKVRVEAAFLLDKAPGEDAPTFLSLRYTGDGIYSDGSYSGYEDNIKGPITQPAPDVLVLKFKELSEVGEGVKYCISGKMTFTFIDRNTVKVREEGTHFMFDDRADSRVERLDYTLKRLNPSDSVIGY